MQFYLIVSAVMLFAGIYGFITRRNLLAILISIELILNAVNINFAVFNHYLYPGALEGLFFALFSIVRQKLPETVLSWQSQCLWNQKPGSCRQQHRYRIR